MTEPQSANPSNPIIRVANQKNNRLTQQAIGILNRKIMIELFQTTGLPVFAKDGVYRIIIRTGGWRHATALVSRPVTVLYETNGMPVGEGGLI